MPGLQLHSKSWTVRETAATRGGPDAADTPPGLPAAFLTSQSAVAEEFVVTPPPAATRGEAAEPLDFSYEVAPGETAVVALRQPSGALTFHVAREDRTRSAAAPGELRFVIAVPPSTARVTRGFASRALKAIVVTIAKSAVDRVASLALAELAAAAERAAWQKNGLTEGWLKMTAESLAAGTLVPGTPSSSDRSLLFLHGTFSHAAAAFAPLASSKFFERVAPIYGDRIFAFNHFSVSKTPEENARELLDALPADVTGHFDVITHSRGGLVLRTLVERADHLGDAASRFSLGRAVLVASPNDGTPLATPERWQNTIGWLANLLEILPDNPFTTGAEFVANGIVWLAGHAAGDLPGLGAMDAAGDVIKGLQAATASHKDLYSALVSNYQPVGRVLDRLIDAGVDQFFDGANDLVVPSSGGWRVGAAIDALVPAARIGCFGAGGNLPGADITHTGFFARPETTAFLVASLTGSAAGLPPFDPAVTLPDRRISRGGAAAHIGTRVRRDGGVSEEAAGGDEAGEAAGVSLEVTVSNGDLTFEDWPLLLGHYRSTKLTGTERVMNEVLAGALERSLDVGLYPIEPGSQQVFLNGAIADDDPTRTPRPAAVIIVGLGSEGKLRAEDLALTIRQAVLAWSKHYVETVAKKAGEKNARHRISLAATLIGSGGAGITAGQAARSIVQGALDAKELMESSGDEASWPVLEQLRLIELYMDRAAEAWRALKMEGEVTPGRFQLTSAVEARVGGLPRALDSGYRGADYDFISAVTQKTSSDELEIAYALDTKRARTEVRAQKTQTRLLKELVLKAANARNADEEIGRTLFGLLVPIEMKPFLAGSDALQLELDMSTAGFPWELLDNNHPDDYFDAYGRRQVTSTIQPWAIRTKLLRKLRTADFRPTVTDASAEASILVIGEPECPAKYPRLPAARREARAVCECLSGPNGVEAERISALISPDDGTGPDMLTIMNALRRRDWRIVHIAGHGALPAAGIVGGVVLSNDTFLSANEIRGIEAVPELVFVNCCHLGAPSIDRLLHSETAYDRGQFAAGVAEELINIGVRCVIAAGWAVDDAAASRFAVTFYRGLLSGERFIDAVAEARAAAFEEGGNTWAAYQCYGDPDWTLRRGVSDPQRLETRPDEFAFIASSAGLMLALETIAVETEYQKLRHSAAEQRERLRTLEDRFGTAWPDHGAVAERFAMAYSQVGDTDKALEWYTRALRANDGSTSMRAAEQLGNLRVRRAWKAVEKARAEGGAQTQAKSKKGTKNSAIVAARKAVNQGIDMLSTIVKLEPTTERLSLFGSAYKRLAMIEAEAGRTKEERRAITNMKKRYDEAVVLAEKTGAGDLFYPALNALAAEAALTAGDRSWKGFERALIQRIKSSLDAKCSTAPDFWAIVGQTELAIYQAVAERRLAGALPRIFAAYEDVNGRIEAKWMWGSVHDTAAFVLKKYQARVASKAEQDAVTTLLARLKALSGS